MNVLVLWWEVVQKRKLMMGFSVSPSAPDQMDA